MENNYNGSNNSIEEIREMFNGNGSTAIFGHVNPDGDCISSCLALKHFLKTFCNRSADVYLEELPEEFNILPGADDILVGEAKKDYDVVFALDCADEGRVGAAGETLKKAKHVVCIDHHISNPGYGDYRYIIGGMSSCCEVLYQLMGDEQLDKDIAICLYTGMVHDTGIFQYSNVTALTMTRAARLISFGFDFPDIIQKTYCERKYEELKASGVAIAKAELFMDGFGIWSWLDMDDMARCGAGSSDVGGIINDIRTARGTDIAVFMHESEPGVWRVSFRSKGAADVSKIAVGFGGGGHVRASGCTVKDMTPAQILARVEEELRRQI